MIAWEEIAAQIHDFPWSVGNKKETHNITGGNISFMFLGTPVLSLSSQSELVLPRRYERFIPLGPEYPPKGKDNRLFETPHGVAARPNTNCQIDIVRSGEKISVTLHTYEAEERYYYDNNSGKQKETELARTVLSWSQAFDDLLDFAQEHWKRPDRIPWEMIIDFIRRLSGERDQPRRALIVSIADKFHGCLPQIVSSLRKILNRERRLMPIGRISEMDGSCLQYYIQQPGRTTAEKAGHRQRLLGIARYESHNLQENRILKDFLLRCARESRRYIQTEVGSVFRGIKRAEEVQRFGALCRDLHRDAVFEGVSHPVPGSPPNYTLLNDARYKEIWKWYRRLLRREDDEDSLWDWQSRTWADVVRLLVGAAIVKLTLEKQPNSKIKRIAKAALRVRRYQLQGSRIWAGTEPGPFVVEKVTDGATVGRAVLEVVNPEQASDHPVAGMFGQTGGHLYLVVQPLGEGKTRRQVIIVWALNRTGTQFDLSPEAIGRSARQAINIHSNSLGLYRLEALPNQIDGIVICNDLSEAEPDAVFADENTATVLRVPARPDRWKESLDWLAVALDEILGGML